MTVLAAVALFVTALSQSPTATQQPKADEFKMVTYQAVFVTKGPKWTTESPDVLPLVRAHREYVAGLLRSGRAHVGGSFAGDASLRAVYILSGTSEEAKDE